MKDISLVNSGTSASRTENAVIYSTALPTDTSAGFARVKFSFVQDGLKDFVTDIVADYYLYATISTGSSLTTAGSTLIQPVFSGVMSFKTTLDITVTAPNFVTKTYAAGSNLLSIAFSSTIVGGKNGSTANLSSSSGAGDQIVFTSDFLDFSNVVDTDFSTAFSAVGPTLTQGANGSLNSFRASAGGQFSSDPMPLLVGTIPEPASWALMVSGFMMLGAALRRSRRTAVAFA